MGINLAPNNLWFLELWRKNTRSNETSHLPIHVGDGDVKRLRTFTERARSQLEGAFDAVRDERQTVEQVRLSGTDRTDEWVKIVSPSSGGFRLQFGRADRRGNSKTLAVGIDVDLLEDFEQALDTLADHQQRPWREAP